jgi:UDP-N-acetylmuramate dehydrogenase
MHFRDIDFSRFSAIRVGPITRCLMIDDEADHYPPESVILGSANNVLIGPEHPPLVKLSKTFDFIRLSEDALHIGAATTGGKVVSFCKQQNLGGLEFMAHLPGTIGGMLKMNAGLKSYEIFNTLRAIRTAKGWVTKEMIDHGYRTTAIDTLVFEAAFDRTPGFSHEAIAMFKAMRSNQPHEPSAGSCFKNPPGDYAGRLIEAVGLKGERVGNMQFSNVHANFLVNLGHGSFEEAMALITLAERRVKEATGIVLEREILVIDSRY